MSAFEPNRTWLVRPDMMLALASSIAVMKPRVVRFGLALLFGAAGGDLCYANCTALHALAQQHANDMARRNSLDHRGFMERRGPAGAVAENVAVGCLSEACARQMWMQSPPHRANMMLGGCQAVAFAVSDSGRRYWAMEIGDITRPDISRARGIRAGRRGGSHDEIVGRDFSIDGSNAP